MRLRTISRVECAFALIVGPHRCFGLIVVLATLGAGEFESLASRTVGFQWQQ